MIRNRIHYWTCSKFADWIRGTPKPYALEWGEWSNWKKETKAKNPARFWLAEEGLDKLQNLVMFPSDLYYTVKTYIVNRWDQSHVLKTGLKPGGYYDLDTKILHGLFTELVDLVEIEMAHMSRWGNDKKYIFTKGRSQEAGLDYLDWASSLTCGKSYQLNKKDQRYNKPTQQALDAQKIRELYLWWKNERPNRPDPFVISGYAEKDSDDELFGKMTKERLTRMKQCDKLERAYEKEDTDKLIQLIKIRRSLWI